VYTNKKYQSIVTLKNHFTVLFTISLAMLFGVFASYNEFASVFMGENFGPKASFLIPYIATGVFFGLLKSFYFDYAFQLCKRTDLQLYSVIFSTVCSVFIHVGLVIYYGVLGAAIACVISFFIYLCTTFLIGRKLMKLPLLSIIDSFKLFVSVMLMFYIVNLLHFDSDISTLIAKILTGVLIFTASIIILNFSNIRYHIIRRGVNG
jgi:O-antigen/teichoic acid export membrane protein